MDTNQIIEQAGVKMKAMGGLPEYGIAVLSGTGAMVSLSVLALMLDKGIQIGTHIHRPYF